VVLQAQSGEPVTARPRVRFGKVLLLLTNPVKALHVSAMRRICCSVFMTATTTSFGGLSLGRMR
jgi:hypothetical protein